jgi:trimethylamine--corrinoid protein Co-methyltransferase
MERMMCRRLGGGMESAMQVSVLNNEQVSKIHAISLNILENIGVDIPHAEMLAMFAEAGALVDFDKKHVNIPPDIVLKSLESAGKKFTLYGRDMNKTAKFGYGTKNFNSSSGQALWLDDIGAVRRYATMRDVADATRLADALKEINIVGAMADPYDRNVNSRCVFVFAEMIKNTTKPVAFWLNDRASAKYIVDMAIAVRGGKQEAEKYPINYMIFDPISPLRFPFDGIDYLFETSRINIPVSVCPMVQMGVSGPGTIAATIAQENAEVLAGICITQLIRPGMPVYYGGICHAFDMANTQINFAGPEQAILGTAMTQMGKFYGLPVYINVGLIDSKCIDAQAGLEAGVTLACGMAAGADIFGHFGICGADQGASLDVLVFQDEVISYLNSVMRDVDFSYDMLGLDEMKEVGPGGTYLDRIFTAEHLRNELWFPGLLDRNYYQSWVNKGKFDLQERCRLRKEELLGSHRPEPVSDSLLIVLDEIVTEAREKLD